MTSDWPGDHDDHEGAKLGQHLVPGSSSPSLLPTLSVGRLSDPNSGLNHNLNCRSVSGAITIIVQEVGITNSLAGYQLISDHHWV